MKKKIAILGSTGSIGKTTFNIIKKNPKKFEIILLTTNKNIYEISKQASIFNVKNLIVTDKEKFLIIKKKLKNRKINIFNNFSNFDKIFKKKIDYTMSSISGLDGLKKTLKFKIDQIIITASVGPFLNLPIKDLNKVSIDKALNHPNWTMGKKISIDSATMMNKVFEVIEAQKIFDLEYKKFTMLIHPKSYLHAIVKFNNGLIKFLAHDTDMSIPIFNSIVGDEDKKIKSKIIDYKILNNLRLSKVSAKRYPSIKILKNLSNISSLYETAIVSVNDELVDLFINKKIKFNDISSYLIKILNSKEILKLKSKSPLNYNKIKKLSEYVRLKTRTLCI